MLTAWMVWLGLFLAVLMVGTLWFEMSLYADEQR